MLYRRAILTLMLGGLLLSCQSPAKPNLGRIRAESYSINPPQAVMYSQTLQNAPVSQATWDDPPWWYTRNDSRLNYRPEAAQRTITGYTIRIHDRMQVYDDRVFDIHRREVWSQQQGLLTR